MRSIDETDISTLNMDQLSQIERLLEDELRWTRARKVVVDRSARLQKKVQGKAAIVEVERGSMEIPIESGQEKVITGCSNYFCQSQTLQSFCKPCKHSLATLLVSRNR